MSKCDICKFKSYGWLATPCCFCVQSGGSKKSMFKHVESNNVGDFKDTITFVLCRGDESERPYCALFQPNEEGDCKFFDDSELSDYKHGSYHLCVWAQGSDACDVDNGGTK